ncbi:MAG: dihydropteroate synthase [Deltaproteobacteria bacterium SM23_61]|nr:MAG: dihydropteroate synthase [Deltaproteobacteria bacterium SM23_61]
MPIQILRFRHREYDLSERTLIMGVLNVTPDSFSDGGRFFEWTRAVEQGIKLAEEGADILDVGGESTRPGSRPVPEEEELRRVIPVIEALRPKISIPISIDTRKAAVAERALQSGAEMVNDVSALRFDEGMAGVVSRRKVPVVLMHLRGQPENMQADTHYDDLIEEIRGFFQERIDYAVSRGISRDRVILDPGIGFGKSMEERHNLILLKKLRSFRALGQPLMIGTSRKAFLGRILDLPPEEREEGTLATVAVAVQNGANIVRVHEVRRTRRAVQVADAILRSTKEG